MNPAIDKLRGALADSGRVVMHTLKPDEFEYYACTFELLDSNFVTEEIFHFPIMPTSMSINAQYPVNIKKTGRGYLVQTSDSFVGKNISLNGSFGRRFKILLHTTKKNGENASTDLKIRTGYGATKMLEKIMDKTRLPDASGNPRFLAVHNYAYNMNVIAEVISFQLSQSMENNMMWNFSIEMKAVADYNNFSQSNKSKGELSSLLKVNLGQQSINRILSNVTPGSLTRAIGF